MVVPVHHFLVVGAILFSLGIGVIISKRNAIGVLIGIELILNAVNLNFVAFAQYDVPKISGQFFSLFVVVVAAAESVVALAIILRVYQEYGTINLDKIDTMKK